MKYFDLFWYILAIVAYSKKAQLTETYDLSNLLKYRILLMPTKG